MSEIRFEDLPVAADRGAGWKVLLDAGDAVKVGDDWCLTGREVVDQALRDPATFSSARAFDSLGSPVPLVPIAMDPPEHARYRRLLDPLLAPKRIAAMEEDLRAQVRSLIAQITTSGRCEIMADLAVRYPAQVFLTLFGLPLEDRYRLIGWKDAVIRASLPAGPNDDDLLAAGELYTYLQGYIEGR